MVSPLIGELDKTVGLLFSIKLVESQLNSSGMSILKPDEDQSNAPLDHMQLCDYLRVIVHGHGNNHWSTKICNVKQDA